MKHSYSTIYLEKEEMQTLLNLLQSEMGRVRDELDKEKISDENGEEQIAFYTRLGNNIHASIKTV